LALSYNRQMADGEVGEKRVEAIPGVVDLRASLLAWYDLNQRNLPWRRTRDPYAIWVSEIMLQQTRVATVIQRFQDFLRNFPTVLSLANANEQDVLTQWSGLGYYRRARMLLEAAKVVAREHRGIMPRSAVALRGLPGIGAYTSAAIASIAFGEKVAVVDGNVERVIQRLAGWGSESRTGQSELAREINLRAGILLDPSRPGDFNQAMMELGATVCLPKKPLCLGCPLSDACQTRGEHPTPLRAPMRSQDSAYALIIRSKTRFREVLLEQRPQSLTVMPGMWELPSLREPEVPVEDLRLAVRHAIMQVNYYARIRTVFEDDVDALTVPSEFRQWVPLRELGTLPLTGLARKVLLRAGIPELAQLPPLRDLTVRPASRALFGKHEPAGSRRKAAGLSGQ
jgi:A/G-specific adenine glycosylase